MRRAAPGRHPGLVAGLALVASATWVTVLARILARWPSSWLGVGAVTLAATAIVAAALVVARRWPRQRDVRAAIADRVLGAALTAAAFATIFTAVALAAGGRPPDVATDAVRACLLAAVVAGLLLGPCSRRIVAAARHIVYGSEGPRLELLDQFSRRVGRAESVDDVLRQLVETARPACAADGAEVWLHRAGRLELSHAMPTRRADPIRVDPTRASAIARAGVSGAGWATSWLPEILGNGGHTRVAPLAVQGDLLGVLVVRRSASRDDFDDADDEGLARVVRLVAAALQNAELDAELRRTVDELRRSNDELRESRARIVTVADDERRRLERDLHDGAQSDLMGIAVKVQLARALLASDAAAATGVLDEIDGDLAAANAQLRSLAHGIFPPLLLTGGLRDALAGIAAHAAVHVEIGDVTAARYDRQIEAAIYFCCAEAVQNAAKHAGPAASVMIDVRESAAGELTLTVHDDGPGFDVASAPAGHGLVNMADRLGALGGTLTVSSNADGTTVKGVIPAADRTVSTPYGSPPAPLTDPARPGDQRDSSVR